VRDEVAAALARFAEDALRRELDQLGAMVQQAVREAQTAAIAATTTLATTTAAEAPTPADKNGAVVVASLGQTPAAGPTQKTADPVAATAAQGQEAEKPGSPEPEGHKVLRREDLRLALDEWWATHKIRSEEILSDLHSERQGLSEREPLKRQQSGGTPKSTPGGTPGCSHSACNSIGSGSGSGGSTATPPSSPFSLPPAISTSTENFIPTPFASPLSTPASAPSTTMMHAFSLPMSPYSSPYSGPAGVGLRKDWRRSFVEKAFKANRKIEFFNGSQCRETAEVSDVLEEAVLALEDGIKPNLVEDGLGGTYFMKDRDGHSVAVFKPRDEEPLAPNNPKVHAGRGLGEGLKEGVLVGEAAINEYAAFLLDQASHPSLRAGVCPTALVRVANSVFHSAKEGRHSPFRAIKDKVGSFQLFAQHDCTSEDMGPSRFPDDQVHRIAALDIRLCNTDRHSGNILVRERSGTVTELVPIDHGYALPGEVGGATFEWLSWPAARRPFGEAIRREILALDPCAVEAGLRRKIPALRDECLATLRACTVLLQRGTEAGLTAFDIGSMMIRPDEDSATEDVEGGTGGDAGVLGTGTGGATSRKASVLEKLVADARRRAKAGNESQPFDQLLDGLIRTKCQAIAEEKELGTP